MGWRSFALVVFAAPYAGCSLITPLDDLGGADGSSAIDGMSQDAPASTDGPSTIDAPPPPNEGGTDASDAGGNLVGNPSFENGSGGCGTGWGNGYSMTFTRVSPGHTGSSACQVCLSGSAGSFQLADINPIAVQPGTYYAEAWLSAVSGGAAANTGIQIYFSVDGGLSSCTGSSTYCQGSMVTPQVGSWGTTSATFNVAVPGNITIDIHTYAGSPSNLCFIVDDVALYQQ